jgi:pentatricopeptide repeat domain-containing protein 1
MQNHLRPQRTALVSAMLEAGAALSLTDEVVHDAVLLLDRTISAAPQAPPELLPLLAAAVLRLSAAQGALDGNGNPAGGSPTAPGGGSSIQQPPRAEAVAAALGVDASALGVMEWRVQQLLGGDTLAISAMRCLKVYLERMGYR